MNHHHVAMLEVCIEDVQGLDACLEANADRVELCSALTVGGLTPSAGFIRLAAQAPINVHVLIRPRAGNFNFDKREVSTMSDDIEICVDNGINGVVLGAAKQDGTLNVAVLRQLTDAAGSLSKTLHRVIDTMDNPLDAMEQAIDLGFDTILTSGGSSCCEDGIEVLQQLHDQAKGRIAIMAGAGLKPETLPALYRQTGITSFHSSCSQRKASGYKSKELGFSASETRYTDVALIRQYQHALQALKMNEY